MNPQIYVTIGVFILLMTVGRVVWRRGVKKIDWDLVVAFVRLDFPPNQRDVAQKIASGLAQIVGLKIKQLRPEHTLEQILGWADDHISATDLGKVLFAAYGVRCDANTTFRSLVEKITERSATTEKRSDVA
jgi:hypothetical protein